MWIWRTGTGGDEMGECDAGTRSVLDQVLDKMFEALEQREEFDEASIGRLKSLRQKGRLADPEQVRGALRPGGGEHA